MFNVSVNDKKNIYRSKPVMNVDTVPKPLTYDYMPEGYPSKSVEYVTLMEEQEVAFSEQNGLMVANSPVDSDIKSGDKLTVVWDGVSYNVTVKAVNLDSSGGLAFGNLGLIGLGDTEDYPFVYIMLGSNAQLGTEDTARSHTIKVMRQQVTITPITYDYMPEGYPSKSVEYVTLMEEQEVAFSEQNGLMVANSPVDSDIKSGDKLTVVWDGVSYNVTVKALNRGPSGGLVFGNLGLIGEGDMEDYPFAYGIDGSMAKWFTADTATSHTIKVMRQQVTITPMSTDFIPKNLNVVFKKESGSTQVNCNATYNELRDWVERDAPVFAVFIDAASSRYCRYNIGGIALLTDTLRFAYYVGNGIDKSFVYKSDGTISATEVT